MALSFLDLIARRLLDILAGQLRRPYAKDIEIAVLRHHSRSFAARCPGAATRVPAG